MPRILFVVLSAVTPAATLDQLARALHPHQVLVHHDFSQAADFRLEAENAQFVPEPRRTGWGTYGLVQGIFHSMEYADARLDFDYLQLLSPTCLPIRPLREFEAHVSGAADAHFGAIDLINDLECLMTIGYRAFTPPSTFRHRVMSRLSREYFRASDARRDEAGVQLQTGGGVGLIPFVARTTIRSLSRAFIHASPFGSAMHPFFGAAWFGARRHIVRAMVQKFHEIEARDYFSRIQIGEEFLIPTMLMDLTRSSTRGSLNHYIHPYVGAHTGLIKESDLKALQASPAFLARKFPDDPQSPVRQSVLQWVLHGRPRRGIEAVLPTARAEKAPVPAFAPPGFNPDGNPGGAASRSHAG